MFPPDKLSLPQNRSAPAAIRLWRRGDSSGARAGFTRLCRLNPADQMAARLALDHIGRHGR